jgi:hypothetical protein
MEFRMPSPLPLPSSNSDVSGLLEFATRLFKHSLSSCLPLAIAAVLASEAAGLYWEATGHKLDLTLKRDATFWWLTAAGTLLSLWISGALIIRQRSLCAGKVGTIRNDLLASGQRWPTVVAASVLAALLTAAGTVALVLPGIYIGVCMSPLLAVALFETLTPVQSLQRSVQLIRPLWVKVFASWLIALMILLVILFTLGLVVALIITPLAGAGRAGAAVNMTAQLAMLSAAQVFICALCFTIYSAANSSA